MLRRHGSTDRHGPVCQTRLRAARVRRATLPLVGLLAAAALLAGCTSVSRSTVDTMRLYWHGTPRLTPTAEQVNAKPYFQMHVTSKGADAILILGNVDGVREYWYGPAGTALVLENGRVVQTIGLAENLDGSRIQGATNPLAHGLQAMSAATTYDRVDDWSPGYRYGVPVHASLKTTGEASIDILGTSHAVMLVTEEVSSPVGDYHATNRYWVDPTDGFVWKSQQQVMPGVTMTLTQLRPYRGARP